MPRRRTTLRCARRRRPAPPGRKMREHAALPLHGSRSPPASPPRPPHRNKPSEHKARDHQTLRPFPPWLSSARRAPFVSTPRGRGRGGAALRASGRATGTSSGNRVRSTAPLRSPAPARLSTRRAVRPQLLNGTLGPAVSPNSYTSSLPKVWLLGHASLLQNSAIKQ